MKLLFMQPAPASCAFLNSITLLSTHFSSNILSLLRQAKVRSYIKCDDSSN
jgi:hypothetical protein